MIINNNKIMPDTCNINLKLILRISITAPLFAFFHAFIRDILLPILQNKKKKYEDVIAYLTIAIVWPLILQFVFNLGLKDC